MEVDIYMGVRLDYAEDHQSDVKWWCEDTMVSRLRSTLYLYYIYAYTEWGGKLWEEIQISAAKLIVLSFIKKFL